MMAHEVLERHRALKALTALFADLFSGDELRRWAHEIIPASLVHELPGENAAPAKLSFELVQVLERHGYIDEYLFERLTTRSPRRRSEVDRVRALFAATRPPHQHRRDPSAGLLLPGGARRDAPPGDAWRRRARVSATLSGACLAVGLVPRLYPFNGVSMSLKSLEKSIFSFLPMTYQGLAFLAIGVCTALITGFFWVMAKGR